MSSRRSDDTAIGGSRAEFPATRRTVIGASASADPEERRRAWETLVEAYWRPVYKHARRRARASAEDAKDFTQAFFARAMEKAFFDGFDPAKGRFRTFLRVCLDGFLAHEAEARRAEKRGGGVAIVSLAFDDAEREMAGADPAAPDSADEAFHAEWVRSLFASAVDGLRARCEARGQLVRFECFRRYDLDARDGDARPTYAEVAAALGTTESNVTNQLHAARRDFREIVVDRLRAWCATEEELREEARALLGVDLT